MIAITPADECIVFNSLFLQAGIDSQYTE